MNSNLKLKSIISVRSDLDSFALCCNFPSKSKAFGMCMYKNIMTFFKYPSFFGSIQFNNFWFTVFFLVQATDFRFVFFSVQQAWTSSNKFWFVEHFSEKKLVLSKCNPYVLEIWFVISDLRFAILFQLWYLRKSYSTDNNEQLKMYVQLWEIFGSIFHLRFYNMIIYFIPRIAKAWALPIQTRNCNKLNNGE